MLDDIPVSDLWKAKSLAALDTLKFSGFKGGRGRMWGKTWKCKDVIVVSSRECSSRCEVNGRETGEAVPTMMHRDSDAALYECFSVCNWIGFE